MTAITDNSWLQQLCKWMLPFSENRVRFRVADMDRDTVKKLRRTGFWWSEDEPHLPHPRDFVDPNWDHTERKKVIRYLESSYSPPYVWCGHSWCRLGCDINNGSTDRTDGVWLYPEGLLHYVKEHHLKPDEEFLNHIRANNYNVPKLPETKL